MPRVPKSVPKKPGPYHARSPGIAYRPPQPATPHEPSSPAEQKIWKPVTPRRAAPWRTPLFTVAGIFAFGIAFYGSSLIVSMRRAPTVEAQAIEQQKDVSGVYDQTASTFDTDIGLSEWLMGVMKVRKQLAGQAKGDVLEVSSGTARNLGYYKFGRGLEDGVRSLTLVDLSEAMVEEGRKKWEILNQKGFWERFFGGSKVAGAFGVPIRFLQGDVRGELPPPPTDEELARATGHAESKTVAKADAETGRQQVGKKGYDTIFQTMGLCSTPSPVELLKNLEKHLNTSNPDARIILLEHGRSYYQWLNNIMDNEAPQHADKHGCWWNRDIGAIVEESGLEIVSEKRKHWGTTWVFELKPKQRTQEKQVAATAHDAESKAKPVSTLSSWMPKWS